MNKDDADRWKSEVLDEIFVAIAASAELNKAMVFKGARVLSLRLGGGRQSLDLDSNLAVSFVDEYPGRASQQDFLERMLTLAIRRAFARHDPVRYALEKLTVLSAKAHPLGWDAFNVKMSVADLSRSVRSLPSLKIDIASPESLLPHSVSPLDVGGYHVQAYTLQRIAGEKLRAFLSSLPTYRSKVKKPGDAIRSRDLYDIGRIHSVHGIDEVDFWRGVGKEFRIACQSRYVDCDGLDTFQEQWEVTRATYDGPTIPKDIPFDQAEAILEAVVAFFEAEGVVPFAFPLPKL